MLQLCRALLQLGVSELRVECYASPTYPTEMSPSSRPGAPLPELRSVTSACLRHPNVQTCVHPVPPNHVHAHAYAACIQPQPQQLLRRCHLSTVAHACQHLHVTSRCRTACLPRTCCLLLHCFQMAETAAGTETKAHENVDMAGVGRAVAGKQERWKRRSRR